MTTQTRSSGRVAELGAQRGGVRGRARVRAERVAGEVEVLLDPGPDLRQALAEVVGDDIGGTADEQRAVAHAREAVDVLDHLRVVVGGQAGLVGAALGHRQPADEVGEEAVGGGLELRVLVQVVVELPRLVADPEVVGLLGRDVVEEHEVGEQDLVHAPPRLEGVELVLARLGGDVARLVGEQRARRVDPLAAALEHARDRILGEPVDLELRLERAQLARDRDVAPGMAEPDRRGHVERALGLPHPAPPGRAPRGPRPRALAEVAQHQVERHRVAGVRAVADALVADELGARRRRRRPRRGRAGPAGPRRPASRAAGSGCGPSGRGSSPRRGRRRRS